MILEQIYTDIPEEQRHIASFSIGGGFRFCVRTGERHRRDLMCLFGFLRHSKATTDQTFTHSRWIWYSGIRNPGCTPSAERDYPT
jgi:hypothetical protein